MTQLSYPTELVNAFAGMLADHGENNDVLSRINEDVVFDYGKAVVHGTDPDKEVLLPTGADTLVGVALHSHANEVGADDLNRVDPSKVFNVLHGGRLFVEVEEAVTPDSTVFVRVSAGGKGLGSFRASDPGGAAALAATGARYITSAAADGFAVLEIDPGATIA